MKGKNPLSRINSICRQKTGRDAQIRAKGTCTLTALQKGQKGIVASVEAQGITRRRLLDLGLVPGTVVEVIRKSPVGDPAAFNIRGAVIALRSEEADRIIVMEST